MAWPIPNSWSGIHPPPSNCHLHHHHPQPHPPLPHLLVVPIASAPTQKKRRKSNHVTFDFPPNAPSAFVPARLQQGTRTHMNQGSVPIPSHDQTQNHAPAQLPPPPQPQPHPQHQRALSAHQLQGIHTHNSPDQMPPASPSHLRTLTMSDKIVPPRPVMPPGAVTAIARGRSPGITAPAPAPALAPAPAPGPAPIIPNQHPHQHTHSYPYGLIHPLAH